LVHRRAACGTAVAAAVAVATALLLATEGPLGAHAVVSAGERQGIVGLYLSAGGAGWTGVSRGWHNHASGGSDPCDPSPWTGVTCNGTTSIT
jgi:hypothetical protein